MTVLPARRLPAAAAAPYSLGMRTSFNGALWPLPVVLAVWMVILGQAVGIWLAPHRPQAALAQCERLQLALAPSAGAGANR